MGTYKDSESDNKLGENAKHLREISGETLQELGRALGFNYNTISQYENGKRQPTPRTLQKIAKRYGKTVDELLHSDLSDLRSMNFSIDGPAGLVKMMEVVLPLSCSATALKNPDFKKGYDYCCRIIDAFSRNDAVRGTILVDCFMAYDKAIKEAAESDETAVFEAVANMVWLIYLNWTQIHDESMFDLYQSLLYPRASDTSFIKKFMSSRLNESDETKKRRGDFINDYDDILLDLLRALKSSPKWTDLADYYLALRYVISLVDTGLSAEMNSAVGMQMMLSFLQLGNPYAMNFVKMSVTL